MKALRDEGTGGAVLVENVQDGVPEGELEDEDLNHKVGRGVAVHGPEEGNAYYKVVGERGDGEDGDHPVQSAAPVGEGMP